MGITYDGLKIMLIKKRRQLQDLHADLGISWGTIAKINKEEYINLNNLEKIAIYLECDIGDLVAVKKE